MCPKEEYKRGKRKKYKNCSVYDFTAGRVRRGYKQHRPDTADRIQAAFNPDDFLLSKHSFLNTYPYVEHPDLPDSSLVLAVHYYMSKKMQSLGNDDLFQQYDPTALLAIAIELEEKIKEMAGPDGHLAFARVKKPGI